MSKAAGYSEGENDIQKREGKREDKGAREITNIIQAPGLIAWMTQDFSILQIPLVFEYFIKGMNI